MHAGITSVAAVEWHKLLGDGTLQPLLCGCVVRMCVGFEAQEVLDQVGKGKPLAAIVEQIGNGSMLRVTLLDGFHYASVQVVNNCHAICSIGCNSESLSNSRLQAYTSPCTMPTLQEGYTLLNQLKRQWTYRAATIFHALTGLLIGLWNSSVDMLLRMAILRSAS